MKTHLINIDSEIQKVLVHNENKLKEGYKKILDQKN